MAPAGANNSWRIFARWARRLRSSIYLETPELKFVVDTGPDFRQQCLREGIQEVDVAISKHSADSGKTPALHRISVESR